MTVPLWSDNIAGAEARLRVAAAKRLAAALITEPGWAGDISAAATIIEHLERAELWLDVDAWPIGDLAA